MKALFAKIIEKIHGEPVVLIHAVTVILSFAASLGFSLDAQQTALVMGAAQLLAGLIARAKVTPMKNLVQPVEGCGLGKGE